MKINLNLILIIIIGFLIFTNISFFEKNKNSRNDLIKLNQNLIASNDSIKSFKLKNDVLVQEKKVLLSSRKTLEEDNKKLYDKNKVLLRDIRKKKSKIISLTSIIGNFNGGGDTLHTIGYKMPDTSFKHPINYNKNGLKLTGNFTNKIIHEESFGVLNIEKWSTEINLTTGIIEDKNGLLKSFVKSDENFIVTDLNTSLFDIRKTNFWKTQDRKRFFLTVNISGGIYYDFFNKQPMIGVGIGIGPSYRIKF